MSLYIINEFDLYSGVFIYLFISDIFAGVNICPSPQVYLLYILPTSLRSGEGSIPREGILKNGIS